MSLEKKKEITTNHSSDAKAIFDGDVYLEGHGISGLNTKPAVSLGRETEEIFVEDLFWISNPSRNSDLRVGFLGEFELSEPTTITVDLQASSLFRAWINGTLIVHGPLRYAAGSPEYNRTELYLHSGKHQVHIEALHEGIFTRTSLEISGFVFARLRMGSEKIQVHWTATELLEFGNTGLRVSPLLGWLEWQSVKAPNDWQDPDNGLREWRPVTACPEILELLGPFSKSEISLPAWNVIPISASAVGLYRDTFTGYELDDPAVQFLLADDEPSGGACPDGKWWRFDLERVRIGTAEIDIQSDSDATVIICYAERLTPEGRPSPIVPLSTGPTRMLQKFRIGPGTSRLRPLQSLGCRYLELRIETRGSCELLEAQFRERDFLGPELGEFLCGDKLLEDIWKVGIQTLRASAEDALVDSVRERGEWLGDVVTSALHLLSAGWGNSALVKRAIFHAAATARPDGLVAGCGPGEIIYLGTYAAQWVTACLEVAESELSLELLHQYKAAAELNMQALVSGIQDDGRCTLPWPFVDWGYACDAESIDTAAIAHVLLANQSWVRWLSLLGEEAEAARWRIEENRLSAILATSLSKSVSSYHSYTLAARAGVVSAEEAKTHILQRIQKGFPFEPSADRLRSPAHAGAESVTPYFTNYSFPLLLDEGLGAQVAEFWRVGWGWMLDQGATTWWEVFDDRWSTCHYWSGGPTWQMTERVLGLKPHLESNAYRIRVNSLGLSHASGKVPLHNMGIAKINWTLVGDEIQYEITLEKSISILQGDVVQIFPPGTHTFSLQKVRGDLFETTK